MASYTAMEWIEKENTDRSREVKMYALEARHELKKFGVEFTRTIIDKFRSLKTKEQVDKYVEKVKKDYMKKYIREKVRLLKDFNVRVTEDHIKYMNSLTSPIYVDNYVQDLYRRIQK